jgi:uncharacterized membrane protein
MPIAELVSLVSPAGTARADGNRRLAPYLMLALAVAGIADAVYVAHASYTGQPLWCPIVEGCNTVVNSPYARVFGVPMAYFGFVYYLYMFALASLLAFDPLSRVLRFRAILYAAMGAASSMYFMYLQLRFIPEGMCIYCLISAVATFLLLIVALWHFRATRIDATTATATKPMPAKHGCPAALGGPS